VKTGTEAPHPESDRAAGLFSLPACRSDCRGTGPGLQDVRHVPLPPCAVRLPATGILFETFDDRSLHGTAGRQSTIFVDLPPEIELSLSSICAR
jgi:hypothetical protein